MSVVKKNGCLSGVHKITENVYSFNSKSLQLFERVCPYSSVDKRRDGVRKVVVPRSTLPEEVKFLCPRNCTKNFK